MGIKVCGVEQHMLTMAVQYVSFNGLHSTVSSIRFMGYSTGRGFLHSLVILPQVCGWVLSRVCMRRVLFAVPGMGAEG